MAASPSSSMNSNERPSSEKEDTAFVQQIGAQIARKLKAQRVGDRGVWFGLGMTGLVGWSVAIPTLLGAALGLWLDSRHPGGRSWTLMLLVAGLCIGCANAWHWVSQQDRAMHEEPEKVDE